MTSNSLDSPPPPLSNPNPLALSKKTPSTAQAWSEHETSHLIAAYQDKWYSLGRGPLKSHQWDDVAASLSARCGYGSRTATQCRHKMEKLRKRYRAEKKQPGRSFWVHFDQMDQMEQVPQLNSVRPPVPSRPHAKPEIFDDESEDEDEDQEENGDDDDEEIVRVENWEWREQEDKNGTAKKLASVVNRLGEGLLRIEKRRMEMMRELERDWMEMEAKRERMWIESRRYVINAISRSFHPKKKAKKSTDM